MTYIMLVTEELIHQKFTDHITIFVFHTVDLSNKSDSSCTLNCRTAFVLTMAEHYHLIPIKVWNHFLISIKVTYITGLKDGAPSHALTVCFIRTCSGLHKDIIVVCSNFQKNEMIIFILFCLWGLFCTLHPSYCPINKSGHIWYSLLNMNLAPVNVHFMYRSPLQFYNGFVVQ
jgi:hypothetical protein